MNNLDYLKWAMTKDRSQAQYDELGNRLDNSTDSLRLLHAAMGISGESGELMDAIKKHILYNKPLDVVNVKEELGDLCWYMALMLDQVGSSFEEVMKMNHDKLEKRFPTGYTDQHAQQRLDKVESGETQKAEAFNDVRAVVGDAEADRLFNAEFNQKVTVLRAIKGSPIDPLESISYDVQHVRKGFPQISFELGKRYVFTHKSGQKISMKRNSKRFYSGKLENVRMNFATSNQDRVYHEIVSVEEA